MGFDRTHNGSANVGQYHEPLASQFNSLETCPENPLLWFHHLPWNYKLSSGRELQDEIYLHYDRGILQVEGYQKTWAKLKPYVSESIFNEVSEKLDIQKNDAERWRDACIGYFQASSNKELPAGVRPLNAPIDSLMNSRVKSNRYGMPYHDENHKPIIIKRS